MKDETEASATTASRRKGRGFFALDVNQFERIQAMNLGLEEAATYLCLLKSTDQSNVTSSGGIRSITEYSGLTRTEAEKAVDRLERAGVLKSLQVLRPRAKTVPRYSLPIHDTRRALAAKEQPVVDAIAAGEQPQGKVELNAAQRALEKGYLERSPEGFRLVEYGNEVAFIPNNFVADGSSSSPLRRLVTHGELGPLMLAAELYQFQNLMDERGVPVSALRSYFYAWTQTRVGQRHRLHYLQSGRPDPETGKKKKTNFSRAQRHEWRSGPGFWANLTALEEAHIVEWAVYAANGKPNTTFDDFAFNRPLGERPLGVLRNGRHEATAPESLPTFAAYLIDRLTQGEDIMSKDLRQLSGAWQEWSPLIGLENQSVGHVEGIGILRMTHRAATENTSVWYRNTRAECQAALFFMEEVARTSFPEAVGIFEALRAQGDRRDAISMYLNDRSTHAQ